MKTIMDELKSVPAKKHMVTTIEYSCPKNGQQDEVFDAVRDIVCDHIEEIAKITYDVNPGQKSVKVEVTQNM